MAFSLEKRYEEEHDERGANLFLLRGAEFLIAGELAVYQLRLESLKAGFAADPFFGNAQLNGYRGTVGPRVKASETLVEKPLAENPIKAEWVIGKPTAEKPTPKKEALHREE